MEIIQRNNRCHVCKLDMSVYLDVVEEKTAKGCFYGLRKWIRRFTMSSETDLLCLSYLKSMYAIYTDRTCHYNDHFWTIHPLSKASAALELIYCIMFIITVMIVCPVSAQSSAVLYVTKGGFDLFFIIYIVLSFFHGYVTVKDKKIILDKRLIAIRYLKFDFFLEALSSFPLRYICDYGEQGLHFIPFLMFFKITRYPYFAWCFRNTCVRFNLRRRTRILLHCTLITLLVYVWTASFSIQIAFYNPDLYQWNVTREGGFNQLMRAFFEVASDISSIGEQRLPKTDQLLYYNIAVLIIGIVLYYFLFAILLYLIMDFQSCYSGFKKLMNEVDMFCIQRELSVRLKNRLEQYFKFYFLGTYYKTDVIESVLSSSKLPREIQIFKYYKKLLLVDVFRTLPTFILEGLTTLFTKEAYLENDVICDENNKSLSFQIILYGTAAVYTTYGIEICHMKDNDYFGELNMVLSTTQNMPKIVALTPCICVTLRRREFENLLYEYPGVYERTYRKAEQNWSSSLKIMEKLHYDVVPPFNFIKEYFGNFPQEPKTTNATVNTTTNISTNTKKNTTTNTTNPSINTTNTSKNTTNTSKNTTNTSKYTANTSKNTRNTKRN